MSQLLFARSEHTQSNTAESTHDISASNMTTTSCSDLNSNKITISRTTLIITLTIFIFTTLSSLLILCALLYRHHHRRKQNQEASSWGRRSRFIQVSEKQRDHMKEIDDEYSRQYRGVWNSAPVENPEMGSDSPIEIAERDRGVWEVASTPVLGPCGRKRVKEEVGGEKEVVGSRERERRGVIGRMSLFFDERVGVWMPKR
ncbi:hypothetical protein AC578_4905 [Pseudocercospora eumusae]|uniref:Transmembrane protein n=1 Tax=Pseudocercospora eumusae TaxID=321146 RepID=A0A139HNU6_9PEZI|nr:hypothetical protein AC578_4905 [Pseudocercospora eumusae]